MSQIGKIPRGLYRVCVGDIEVLRLVVDQHGASASWGALICRPDMTRLDAKFDFSSRAAAKGWAVKRAFELLAEAHRQLQMLEGSL